MTDLVSIVIPAFNRSSLVGGALDSLAKQTYPYWEAMVVDDGSVDETVQVVRQYIRNEPRVRLIEHGQRKGSQAARNTGIHRASGDWVGFLDSDDQWLPDSLERRLDLVKKSGVEVVHSECFVLHAGATSFDRFGIPPMQGRVYKLLLKNPGPAFPALLVSKKAIRRIGYLDENIVSYQEWDTSIRLAKYYDFAFVPEPTFIYDCRHPDTISKNLLREAMGYQQVFTKHRRAILWYLGPKALASHYETVAGLYRNAKQSHKAHKCLRAANLWWPFRPQSIIERA